jgi:protein transport protein YIF1
LHYFFSKEIRFYFDVSNNYVLRKLSIVLFPMSCPGEWGKTESNYNQEHLGFLSPKDEIHAPDLYIPLMAVMTFVLIICFSRGQE